MDTMGRCTLRLRVQAVNDGVSVAYPTKNRALCFDHLQREFLEFREVRADTILRNNALKAAVIGFAHGGGDADFGSHPADDEGFDAVVLKHQMQISLVKRAFARFVDN